MISFSIKRPGRSDLVIYDRVGSRFIVRAIANRAKWLVFDTRSYRIPIHPLFFFSVLKTLLILPKKARQHAVKVSVRLIYEYAWIHFVQPRVVVSFIDNNIRYNSLSQLYTKALFIGVQNGFRNDAISSKAPRLSVPTLVCFGQQTIDLYKKYDSTVSRFVIGGSLKSGLFEETRHFIEKQEFDICWISQYRPARFNRTMPGLKQNTEKQIAFLNQYCTRMRKTLVVAGSCRDRRFAHEYRFLLAQLEFKPIIVSPNDDLNFSSYKLIRRSKLAITTNSTIGFEALSAGDRVLFLNLTDDSYYDVPEPYRNSVWSLSGADLDHDQVSKRVNQIMEMTENEWQDALGSGADYFVHNPGRRTPQEILWAELSSGLES
jgi:surface carbohydrate biosynthesis protein